MVKLINNESIFSQKEIYVFDSLPDLIEFFRKNCDSESICFSDSIKILQIINNAEKKLLNCIEMFIHSQINPDIFDILYYFYPHTKKKWLKLRIELNKMQFVNLDVIIDIMLELFSNDEKILELISFIQGRRNGIIDKSPDKKFDLSIKSKSLKNFLIMNDFNEILNSDIKNLHYIITNKINRKILNLKKNIYIYILKDNLNQIGNTRNFKIIEHLADSNGNIIKNDDIINVNLNQMPKNFSYKKFRILNENEYEFYLKYILNLDQIEENKYQKGLILHEIFAKILSKLNNNNEINLKEIYHEIGGDKIVFFNAIRHYAIQLIDISRKIFNEVKKNNSIMHIEKSFFYNTKINQSDVQIVIRPDLVIENNDNIEVYDLKTSSMDKISNEASFKTPQLMFYGCFLSRIFNKRIAKIAYIIPEDDIFAVDDYDKFDLIEIITKYEKCVDEKLKKLYNPQGYDFKKVKN